MSDRPHFRLLTHGTDAARLNTIRDTAMTVEDISDKLKSIALEANVLLLIDACRTDAYAADGAPLDADPDYLTALLQSDRISVIASSSEKEASLESDVWENGAFTEAVLEALGERADFTDDGLISMTEFATFIVNEVPYLTKEQQTPSIRVAYQKPLFLAAK